MQWLDKNMHDVSDKILTFINMLTSWEDVTNVSVSSQWLLSCLISMKRNEWCCLQIYEVYFCNIYLSSRRNIPQYFPENLSSYQLNCHAFVQPIYPPLLNKKKKTMLTSHVIIPWKESLFSKSDKLLDFIEWRTPSFGEKHYGSSSLSLRRIYAKQDLPPQPWFKPNIDHE